MKNIFTPLFSQSVRPRRPGIYLAIEPGPNYFQMMRWTGTEWLHAESYIRSPCQNLAWIGLADHLLPINMQIISNTMLGVGKEKEIKAAREALDALWRDRFRQFKEEYIKEYPVDKARDLRDKKDHAARDLRDKKALADARIEVDKKFDEAFKDMKRTAFDLRVMNDGFQSEISALKEKIRTMTPPPPRMSKNGGEYKTTHTWCPAE